MIDHYRLERTHDCLGVDCNPAEGSLVLEGSSYPEDAFSFFEPIRRWVETYLATKPKKLELTCRIDYLSSSSSKCLFDLFDTIAGMTPGDGTAAVRWIYPVDDPDVKEMGEEFAEDVDIPFVFEPTEA